MPTGALRIPTSKGDGSPAFLASLEAIGRARPGGEPVPSIVTLPVVEDAEDRPIDLERRLVGRPVVLLFYAGGWSKPCVEALRMLQTSIAALAARSYGVVALTPESVEEIGRTAARNDLSLLIGHDHGARFARSLGLSFRLTGEARSAVRTAGIRLSVWNGDSSFELPQPATVVLNAERGARVFQPDRHDRRRSDVEAAVRYALAADAGG